MSETLDSLSSLLRQLHFSARVFFTDEYCGSWAIDSSGSCAVPFHLVAAGEGWLHLDGAAPQRLLSGQLVLFPQDRRHVLSGSESPPAQALVNAAPPGRRPGESTRLICGYYEFDRSVAEPLLSSLPQVMVLDLSNADSASTRSLVNLWIEEAAQRRPEDLAGREVAVDRLAEVVFIRVLRNAMEAGQMGGIISALGDKRLGPAIAAIHGHPNAVHSVPQLAQLARMSESAFAQRFRKQLGIPVGQYVRHWRMSHAARSLTESDRSIAQIAAQCGYTSEVAFRKAFRAHFDIAPGRYRRNAARIRAAG